VSAAARLAAAVAAAPGAVPVTPGRAVFDHVLAGIVLEGDAARLAAALDPLFLVRAGWDPAGRVLAPPDGDRLLGRGVCRFGGCTATAWRPPAGAVCQACRTRLLAAGFSEDQLGPDGPGLPSLPDQDGCAVPGCAREPTARQARLCKAHAAAYRNKAPVSLEAFAGDPAVRPLPPCPPCPVPACIRSAVSGSAGAYCQAHRAAWQQARRACPGVGERAWQARAAAVAEAGRVSLRGLPPLIVVQILYGIWRRAEDGVKIPETVLRRVCDALRREQVISIFGVAGGPGLSTSPRTLLAAMARHVRLALADPAAERARDVWDMAVFGHRGRLTFTGITQPWLREAAKTWVQQELPRHRRSGGNIVRDHVKAIERLSESLRARADRGEDPAGLGRADIDDFCNRLGYLESAGEISRRTRTHFCRALRTVLPGIRSLGLTRAGQAAAGLPGDVVIRAADIPAEPEPAEPARDLPDAIMAVLCANLPGLTSPEVRVAVQLLMDTGRRPEDIAELGLDCLTRDPGDQPVLVYDNIKAHRLGRRLPVSEATAQVIIEQQQRVRSRFPGTPVAELALLPSPQRNPDGTKAITRQHLEHRHRQWAGSLGELKRADGSVFDSAQIVLYAYRHTYAQRHADAGVPIDVLAELMDHRNINLTRRYFRVGEQRRREAVDRVTTLTFDRHGNRIWRQATALSDVEYARYAISRVAVPFGRCSEPSNVQAGGASCPFRFRCAGCEHFSTDPSHLPDLQAYLQQLLAEAERLRACTNADAWVIEQATPREEEIQAVRRLIRDIQAELGGLDTAERVSIDEAVATIRRARAAIPARSVVPLPVPTVRPGISGGADVARQTA
jgi:integrase